MGEEAAPVPPPPSESLRIWYAVVQALSLSVFLTLCWISQKFEEIYAQLEMKTLPLPTELFIAVTHVVRTPLGFIVTTLLFGIPIALGLRGTFDRFLRKLVVVNVVGVGMLVAFYVLALVVPILKIQQALKDL
jgi:hypothetical protein